MKPMMDQELQQGINAIKNQVSTVDTKVSGVLSLLKGNELNKDDKGILGDVADALIRIEKLERFKEKAMWIGVGMTIPTSFGVWQILQAIILHK